MHLKIEPYHHRHTQEIIHMILAIQQQEFQLPLTLENQPDLADIAAYYQQGAGTFLIAILNEQPIGTLGLLDIGNQQGVLRKMFVKKEFRGQPHQVAARLLAGICSWAKDHDLHELFLGTTDRYLAAHRFYEKNDFLSIQPENLPPAFPRMQVDSLFYRLALS